MSSELLYEVLGDQWVVRQQTGDSLRMVYDPPVPFCGTIPSEVSYRVKATVLGQNTVSQGKVTFKELGHETVVVPAGSFKATVFEARQETQTNPSSGIGSPGAAPVIRSYMADGVGLVKTIIISSARRPVGPVTEHPEANAVLQQGLEAMSKGEDVSATIAKLGAMTGPDSRQFEEVKTEAVTELVTYQRRD